MRLEFRLCRWAVNNGCARFFGKVEVPGDKIGMEMRFEYIFDLCAVILGFIKVRLHFAQRVKNRCFAIAFKVIRRLCDASGIDLFYFHGCYFLRKTSFRMMKSAMASTNQ